MSAIFFAPSFNIIFKATTVNNYISFSYYKILTENEYDRLLSGQEVEIDIM